MFALTPRHRRANADERMDESTSLLSSTLDDSTEVYLRSRKPRKWNQRIMWWFWKRKEHVPRLLWLSQQSSLLTRKKKKSQYPRNVIRNQKYNVLSFIPIVLYNQFKFFQNLFFLITACSQFFPVLRIGEWYTYWGPLIFVLSVTMFREAVDDWRRFKRDKQVNSSKYAKLLPTGTKMITSAEIEVGDLIYVNKGSRVPADMVLVRTTEPSGTCFIRTDQLDGETDWKLRISVSLTQNGNLDGDQSSPSVPSNRTSDIDLYDPNSIYNRLSVYAEKPQKDIHSFIGRVSLSDEEPETVCEESGEKLEETNVDATSESLNVENTIWANTVVASGTALGIVVYTGRETRASMNTSQPRSKQGLLDYEVNRLTKLLFLATLGLSFLMVCMKGFGGPWYFYVLRFLLLFSYIIPISLRVNLDMGKIFYSYLIQKDTDICGTVVRTTTIPEELGRISYLLTDKTGTLTQNKMVFKKLHMGSVSYSTDSFDDVKLSLIDYFSRFFKPISCLETAATSSTSSRVSSPLPTKLLGKSNNGNSLNQARDLFEAVKALALCHNVTPVSQESENMSGTAGNQTYDTNQSHYQASSPDEIALVSWCEQVGLILTQRSMNSISLASHERGGVALNFTILHVFPFTSESKRMGIIVKDNDTDEHIFYMKGADSVMNGIVCYADWLNEEVENMGREGLRTLVVGKKRLSVTQYADFDKRYAAAKISLVDRNAKVNAVMESLEVDLELLCVTGVEDKLQHNVRNTLEMLRNAGIKIWMLTGDKLETAECIAKSSRLVSKNQSVYIFKNVESRSEAHLELNTFRRKQDCALIITGSSLNLCLEYYEHEFMELAVAAPSVVCCRCSPQQKAHVVKLIQSHTNKIAAAIGDGGNDVSMIQASSAGIGIVGLEGMQASLAADFSITRFSHVARLLLVHGRNSYKRSASLSQFVIHRGLIISTMQIVFSAVFFFSSVSLYQGLLMVGYGTIYTMFPVFSLVLDQDISPQIALTFPELYKDLVKGRSLSTKTFFIWVLVSIYQGGVIMFGALLLFEDEFIHIVSISFTSLILTELIMVGLTVRTWHIYMIFAEAISLLLYVASLFILKDFFDVEFIWTASFLWKTSVITAISCVPLYIIKFLRKQISPSSYQKLS